jgi:hypothetical protein
LTINNDKTASIQKPRQSAPPQPTDLDMEDALKQVEQYRSGLAHLPAAPMLFINGTTSPARKEN